MCRKELKTKAELLESKRNCEEKAKATKDPALKAFYLNAAKGFKIRSNALIVLR